MRDAQTHRRLAQLYEISQLVASVEDVEETFRPVVEIAVRTLALRSAILMKAEAGRPRMMGWPAAASGSKPLRAVVAHVETAYASLVTTPTPPPAGDADAPSSERVVVIPLVVADRPPFGVLQVEGTNPFDRTDLLFVHAIANQLAIAFDRDRARQRDISRRESSPAGSACAAPTARTPASAKPSRSWPARPAASRLRCWRCSTSRRRPRLTAGHRREEIAR